MWLHMGHADARVGLAAAEWWQSSSCASPSRRCVDAQLHPAAGQTGHTWATHLRLVTSGQLKAAQPPVAAALSPAEALASSCSAQLIQLCLSTR